MKKTHLTLHLFPKEIDDYELTVNQLKIASQFLTNLEIDANIILNLNDEIIDWKNSKLPKDFFVDKFNKINEKLDWINKLDDEIVFDNSCKGYLYPRIENTKLEGYDYFWWQDVDLILDDLLFYGLEQSLEQIIDTKFLISPQIYKFWDNSWDVISSFPEKTINVDEFDAFNIKLSQHNRSELSLYKNYNVKFAGGWFTFISNELIKEIPWPYGYEGYGREDTLLQEYCKKNKYPQYIMRGLVVQENRKYLSNSLYDDYVVINFEKLKKINHNSMNKYYEVINSLWTK